MIRAILQYVLQRNLVILNTFLLDLCFEMCWEFVDSHSDPQVLDRTWSTPAKLRPKGNIFSFFLLRAYRVGELVGKKKLVCSVSSSPIWSNLCSILILKNPCNAHRGANISRDLFPERSNSNSVETPWSWCKKPGKKNREGRGTKSHGCAWSQTFVNWTYC